MTSFPETEIIVKVNGEIVLHVEPLDEQGMGNVLVPGDAEMPIVQACLADALLITTGPRPSNIQANFTVVNPRQLGLNDDATPRGSHLRLVQTEPKP